MEHILLNRTITFYRKTHNKYYDPTNWKIRSILQYFKNYYNNDLI